MMQKYNLKKKEFTVVWKYCK